MKKQVLKKSILAMTILIFSMISFSCNSDTVTTTSTTQGTTLQPTEIMASDISLSGSMYVCVGTTAQYNATVIPDNAINLAVEWSVISRGGEAEIDQTGLLSANASGGVTVRGTLTNGLFAEIRVAILSFSIPVSSVEILGDDSIVYGERASYAVTVSPANATYRNITWSIETGNAKIDSNGRFAAKQSGEIVIGVNVDGIVATKTISVSPYQGSVSAVKVLLNRVDLRNTVLKDYEHEFEALFPMYNVTFETITDYENNARMRLMGGEYGDVLLIPSSVSAKDLSYYFAPIGNLDTLSQSWRYVSQKAYNGIVYGLPTYGNVNGILYNKLVFENAGITELPTSPAAFLNAMQTIKTYNSNNTSFLAPFYTNKKDSWPLDQWQGNVSSVSGNPDYYYNLLPQDRNAFSVGSPHYIVYKLLYDLVYQGLIENDPSTTNWERSKVEFVKGNIGAMVAGSWAVSQFMDVAVKVRDGTFQFDDGTPGEQSNLANPDHVGYMPFPYTNSEGEVYSAQSPDFFIGINRTTSNMQGANDFLMWFLQESGYYQLTGGIPPRMDMPFPDVIQSFQELGVILFEENPATGSMIGKLELVESYSGIILWNPDWKNDLFEEAFYKSRSFDQIAAELNQSWISGINIVG